MTNYIKIDFEVLDNVKDLEQATVLNILLHCKTMRWQKTKLADMLYIERRRLDRILNKLRDKGYIEFETSGWNRKPTTLFTLKEKALELKEKVVKQPRTKDNHNTIAKEKDNKNKAQTTATSRNIWATEIL